MTKPSHRQIRIQRARMACMRGVTRRFIGGFGLVLMALGPSRAVAEVGAPTPTVQAVAADATWLAYTPPPEHPGIVCMVDSGVDPNPDTEAAVIGGKAIAPETETNDEIARLEPRAQPGNHPNGHGTLMAMMMAAPINGWGMVGIAPTSVRVYNMKALPKGETTFPFYNYATAIKECQQRRQSVLPSITVINLSLGGSASPNGAELTGLGNFVASAHQSNIAVVAAAGNDDGPVLYPAAYPSIFAVGAGDIGSTLGALCSFASRGERLNLVAPGCDSLTGGLEGAFEDDGSPAFGSGSSQASSIVSAVLASMRAYSPQLSYSKAEECLTTTTDNGSINVEAAFEACGLSHVVSEGQAAERIASQASQGQTNQGSSTGQSTASVCIAPAICAHSPMASDPGSVLGTKTICPRPRVVGVVSRHDHLVVRVRERPHGCLLQARQRVKAGFGYQWKTTPSRPSIIVRLSRLPHPYCIEVRFAGGVATRVSSSWIVVSAS